MENHRSTSTIDRSGRVSLVPWKSLEAHAPAAFTVAGASLLSSLFVPLGLLVIIDWSWLVGIGLVGLAVVTAALGLLGLHPRTSADSPWLSTVGAAFAATAGSAGLVVLVLTGLSGAAIHAPDLAFSVGKQTFVALALTMAAGYGLGFLTYGIGTVRSRSEAGPAGTLLTAGGLLLLVPVVGGVLQFGLGIDLPAWVVFPVLGLVSFDTLAVGLTFRPTS